MPFLWKKNRVTRISWIVIDLQPPKCGGSFIIEINFPILLINLFVKNRSQLKKLKSKKWIQPEIFDPSPLPLSLAPPPLPDILSWAISRWFVLRLWALRRWSSVKLWRWWGCKFESRDLLPHFLFQLHTLFFHLVLSLLISSSTCDMHAQCNYVILFSISEMTCGNISVSSRV